MKRFDKLQTILFILIVFCWILLVGRYDNIFANTELFVNLKDDRSVYINEAITTDMFEFQLGNRSIYDLENIEMSPNSFSNTGNQFITFTYKNDNATYMKKVMVNVQSVEVAFLSSVNDTISLIQHQQVTKEQLPEIYLHYNNGEKKQIMDYAFSVDWEKKIVCISYDDVHLDLKVDVMENKMDYLEITSYLNEVPENYIFDENDIAVTLHYTNGTKEKITDYQIIPYKLVEGYESYIYVTYKEMIGNFKVKATKEVVKTTSSPIDQPLTLLPDLSLLKPQTTAQVEETETPVPEYSAVPELKTLEPNVTVMPEETETLTPKETQAPTPESVKSGLDEISSTLEPTQNDQLEMSIKDITAPETNICEKTYTKNIKISVTDESGIASIVLRGSINKVIKNGYQLTKEGSYRLVLTDVYGNAKTVRFKLQKPAKKIKVSYSFTSKWNVIKFSAKVTGTSRAVKWSVSDIKIATVEQNGTFKVKKSGTVYLIAKLDKKKVKQKIKIEKKKKSILLY